MELFDPCESSTCRDEKVEAMDLLEEYWFFDNLLHGRTKMVRCSSGPSPTSSNCQQMAEKNPDDKQSSSIAEVGRDDGFFQHNLFRTPSLPPCLGREKVGEVEESNCGSSKLTKQASVNPSEILPPRRTSKSMTPSPNIRRHRLQRDSMVESVNQIQESESSDDKLFSSITEAPWDDDFSYSSLHQKPSLPTSIGREKVDEAEDTDRGLRKLTRQASLNPSDILPPRRTSKSMTQSPGIRRHRVRRDSKVESMNKDSESSDDELSSSITGSPWEDDMAHCVLLRTPSLPTSIEWEKVAEVEEIDRMSGKLTRQASLNPSDVLPPRCTSKTMAQSHSFRRHRVQRDSKEESSNKDSESSDDKLSSSIIEAPFEDDLAHHLIWLRTPSLPTNIDREKVAGAEEIGRRSRKLTHQVSLNSSGILPPQDNFKSMTTSYRIPRHRTRRETKVESMNKDSKGHSSFSKEENRGTLSRRKTLSDLEFEEVQGFRDLGFSFNKEDLNPSVVDIIPGLQEKSRVDSDENKVRRPYLSEAWHVQRSAPPIPNWVDKRSVGDMKEQLKFWARAVATNVRQEC